MKKIVRFTEYRINHVRNRRSGLNGYMVSRQVDHLHNLDCNLIGDLGNIQVDIRDAITINQSQDIQVATDTRGKLPATINHLVDRLRDHAKPAVVCHFANVSTDYRLSTGIR